MKKLTIVKFGGSLIDVEDMDVNTIVKIIKGLKERDKLGPIAIFSAPRKYTDILINIGKSRAQFQEIDLDTIFNPYLNIVSKHIKSEYQNVVKKDLKAYREEVEVTLRRLNKRFEGNNKARLLTFGGELPTSCIIDYIIRSNGINSCHIPKENWPIITNDDFENATPNYEKSKKKIDFLIKPLEEGKFISQAGFLGMTDDYLETILGRGGSDQTAVFDACLLKDRYDISILLLKETPVLSADPKIVKNQKLDTIRSMTYNEAIKATTTGMKIVQSTAVRLAKTYQLPIKVAPVDNINLSTIIKAEDPSQDIVKCVTGTKNSAILTINNEKSKSLEDCIRLWENYEDFIDLGTEVLETGKAVRDFLFLDGNFIKRNEENFKNFDQEIEIEYNVGVVTLIGDRMRYSPGVASIAIGAIPNINIKRAVFAPHTSQIIIVLDEKNIREAVLAIHSKRNQII